MIEFLGLANIHNVRSYFHQLRTLLNAPCDPNSFYQNLQGTAWLQSIWHIFQATARCIKALCFESNILSFKFSLDRVYKNNFSH